MTRSGGSRWTRGFLVVAAVSALLVGLLALMSGGYLGPALRNPWVVGVTPLLFGAAFVAVLAVRRRRGADVVEP